METEDEAMNARRLRIQWCSTLFALLLCGIARAGSADTLTTSGTLNPWEFSVAGSYYAFPDDPDLFMVVASANRGLLHLEARYNYEARQTASAFAGLNFSSGQDFTVDLTPMAGFAFGDTRGLIPALELSLGYGLFDFYGEGEYLFDLNDKAGNFAYTWLELGATPMEYLRAGFVAQRLRIFQSPLDIDRGVFIQGNIGPGSVSLYAFNMFTDSWFVVIGVGLTW
jgi:hypothetical protein